MDNNLVMTMQQQLQKQQQRLEHINKQLEHINKQIGECKRRQRTDYFNFNLASILNSFSICVLGCLFLFLYFKTL